MHVFPATFSAREFTASRLATIKAKRRLSVSVCLPARDEESTVGAIVAAVREELVERTQLVDEILVIDDRSTDATAAVAAAAGAIVVASDEILPEVGPGSGKGDAMWKSLHASSGDIVCWLDADVRAFDPGFVTGLLGPLVTRPDLAFVKGFYERPSDGPSGGGRVTELVARPLISLLFPHLAGIVQPLAGEYAARRELVEALPFVEGWGVELGLLIDVAERRGIGAMAQVDLGTRVHRNRPLEQLSPQAMAIVATALRRAGFDGAEALGAELVRFDDQHRAERVEIETRERPPMLSVPAYQAKFGRELTA